MLAQASFDISTGSAGLTAFVAVVALILTAVVHVCFALAVFNDAGKLSRPTLVGPAVWAIATLLGGVIAAGIYWAVNRSMLVGRVAGGVASAQAPDRGAERPSEG